MSEQEREEREEQAPQQPERDKDHTRGHHFEGGRLVEDSGDE